jgi:hypothetical protein
LDILKYVVRRRKKQGILEAGVYLRPLPVGLTKKSKRRIFSSAILFMTIKEDKHENQTSATGQLYH